MLLPAMLARQAVERPDAIAVLDDHRALNFRALLTQASRLAGIIAQAVPRRVGDVMADADAPLASSCVGLYVESSMELVVGVWGILGAGLAYLPLSPDYPDERIRYIAEHSRVQVIVTQAHLLERIRAIVPAGTRCLVLEQDEAPAQPAPAWLAPCQLAPHDLAYVIYTSGSTGQPKGVMIEQHSIASQMRWLAAQGYLLPQDRILQKTPMSFDAAQWEILAPAVGATVVASRPGLYRDVQALIQTIQAQAVTRLQCVPTLLHALVEDEAMAGCSSLVTVFSGGEALSQKLAAQCLATLPQCALVNLYGPTECTINATWHPVRPQDVLHPDKSVPIGQPVAGCACHLLNEQLRPVAPGEGGELYIGGAQVARGYLHDAAQTAQRFVTSPFLPGERLYRSGDRCVLSEDGLLHFAGRSDHQVKLRGYRVELEEISTAIERHSWIRQAVVLVTEDRRHGSQILSACVELNEKEAALMDQGLGSGHHQSKADKLQVKAQLNCPGLRELTTQDEGRLVALAGAEASPALRQAVFARKTYRFFDGGNLTQAELAELFSRCWFEQSAATQAPRSVDILSLGEAMRWMGSFHSPERLLPKYAYASPGALYATQLYLESRGLPGLDDGLYYHHPVRHALVYIDSAQPGTAGLRWHFVGKHSAIDPIYKHNIQEVLEIEVGHMVAVLQEALAPLGCGLAPAALAEPLSQAVPTRFGVADEDFYLGAFDSVSSEAGWRPPVELYVQPLGRGVAGMEAGTYRVSPEGLARISDQRIEKRHVIAINQQVFQRASVGISVVSRCAQRWLDYVALGYALHVLQRNDAGLGFMSSGYSSKTGHPLPAFRQLQSLLAQAGIGAEVAYFFIGGKVSQEQWLSEGMREDCVHMQGPAEMIREELAHTLPSYMIPNRVLVFDRLPLTANGKVDRKALAASKVLHDTPLERPVVPPATPTEAWLADVWENALRYRPISREDDFFALGGNSLAAITSLHKINQAFQVGLPAQVLFELPRLCDLAARIDACRAIGATAQHGAASRFVRLNAHARGRPVFCWPGLGGYPMNLRGLAQALPEVRPFFGIQSYGLNEGEMAYPTIAAMAQADVAEIQTLQAQRPLTLWGYSFGARLAFESAWQLEQQGREVERLVLICPGNPRVDAASPRPQRRDASLKNRTYVAILLSVFIGEIDLAATDRFLATGPASTQRFAEFVQACRPDVALETICRIMAIVGQTYEFEYSFAELARRSLRAPIIIVKAQGDDYSFIESARDYALQPPLILQLALDHYAVLRSGAQELAGLIHRCATRSGNASLGQRLADPHREFELDKAAQQA